jgi:hypothetical protein
MLTISMILILSFYDELIDNNNYLTSNRERELAYKGLPLTEYLLD